MADAFTPHQFAQSFPIRDREVRFNKAKGKDENVDVYRQQKNGPIQVLEFLAVDEKGNEYVDRQQLLCVAFEDEDPTFKAFTPEGSLWVTAHRRYTTDGKLVDGTYSNQVYNKSAKVMFIEELTYKNGNAQGPAKRTFMDGDEVAFIEEFTYQDGDAQGPAKIMYMDGDEVMSILEFTYQDGDAQGLGFSVVGDDITNIMLWNNKNIIRDVSIDPSINMKQLNINAADMLCQMGLPESSMLQSAVRLNELTAKLIQNGCDAVNVAGIARLSVVAYNLAQKG